MSDEAKRTSKEQIECYLRRIEELWEGLAGQLNALKGPTRSAAKWRECLSHWKNQARSRARKTKALKMATGGGPCSQGELGAMEQRALDAFGTTVVDGISDVPTLGLETEFVGFNVSDTSSHTCPTSSPSSSRKRKATSTEMVMELAENIKKRNEEERQYRSDSF